MSTADIWALTHEQRNRLGDLLETLADADWNVDSLCTGWRVRDVAAHCVETQLMTPGKFVGRLAGAGFRFNTFNQKGVDGHTAQSTAELVSEFRASAGGTNAPPGPKLTWLAEALIHGEDIARPLGRTLGSTAQALVTVADYARKTSPLLHGKQRSAGLTLRATDAAWSAGEGPEVSGPIGSLILAITGRGAALIDLSGEGLDTLRTRV
jgi:uncharacterized protein (TIGR03083 family)